MQTLLDRGADVNRVYYKNYISLRYSFVWKPPIEIIQTLLENSESAEIQSNNSITPVHDAAMMDSEKAASLLLRCREDIHAREKDGGTPLHFAAGSDHLTLIQYLLHYDAEIKFKTEDGITAFYLTAVNEGEKVWRIDTKTRSHLKL